MLFECDNQTHLDLQEIKDPVSIAINLIEERIRFRAAYHPPDRLQLLLSLPSMLLSRCLILLFI